MLDLENARQMIDGEKCVPDSHNVWCITHKTIWQMGSYPDGCPARPEVADVAAELLAAVKRVQALAAELETTNTAGRLIGKSIRERLEGTDNA